MLAIAGAAGRHNLICMNIYGLLRQQFGQRPCRSYPSEMRVRVSATGLNTYPDVVAVCGEPKFLDEHRDTLLNPALIVEVLSPSTEAYDRGRKFEQYRSIDSLAEDLTTPTSTDAKRTAHGSSRRPGSQAILWNRSRLAAASFRRSREGRFHNVARRAPT